MILCSCSCAVAQVRLFSCMKSTMRAGSRRPKTGLKYTGTRLGSPSSRDTSSMRPRSSSPPQTNFTVSRASRSVKFSRNMRPSIPLAGSFQSTVNVRLPGSDAHSSRSCASSRRSAAPFVSISTRSPHSRGPGSASKARTRLGSSGCSAGSPPVRVTHSTRVSRAHATRSATDTRSA